MKKLLFIFSLYCLSSQVSNLLAQNTRTDSICVLAYDSLDNPFYIRYTTTYEISDYVNGDSIDGVSTATRKRMRVSPLALPVSSAMQQRLNDSTGSIRNTLNVQQAAINGKQAAGSYVTQATTVNGHALSGNVVVTAADVGLDTTRTNVWDELNVKQAAINGKLATNGNGSSLTGLTAAQVGLDTTRTNVWNALNGKQATLTAYTRQVGGFNVAATTSATAATTLVTPGADGWFRVMVYLKISTTGTSPVAGPVTVTYTSADGSVAQSHVLLMQSVTGTVVTTTVNNSTTTGTVNGSMVIYAKSGVPIQVAIAVSGTYGAGRYVARVVCEQL